MTTRVVVRPNLLGQWCVEHYAGADWHWTVHDGLTANEARQVGRRFAVHAARRAGGECLFVVEGRTSVMVHVENQGTLCLEAGR